MTPLERVAVFAPSYPPAYLGGGPARTLEALVREAPEKLSLSVVAPSRDLDGSVLPVQTNEWIRGTRSRVMYAPVHTARGLKRAYGMVRETRPDLIYLNSFFDLRMSVLPQLLARFRFWGSSRILLAPRGEFNAGALQVRPMKKKLFILVYKMLKFPRRVAWHASTELEASTVRRLWGQDALVLVREDETGLPEKALEPTRQPGELRAVFLGRIVRNKGLLTALRALRTTRGPVLFDIYGPNEDPAYFRECELEAAQCPPNVEIRFRGAIAPEEVRGMLSKMDVMLMPTSSENFGHVIAEALSVSCPVICSPHTPWTQDLESGGGLVADITAVDSWTEAIETFSLATPDERLLLRQRAGQAFCAWRKRSKGPHVLATMADIGLAE